MLERNLLLYFLVEVSNKDLRIVRGSPDRLHQLFHLLSCSAKLLQLLKAFLHLFWYVQQNLQRGGNSDAAVSHVSGNTARFQRVAARNKKPSAGDRDTLRRSSAEMGFVKSSSSMASKAWALSKASKAFGAIE